MKWIALALMILAVPCLALWLRSAPRNAPLLHGLLGFLPFVLGPWHLSMAIYATPMWSGYVKGWEVSLLDAVALAILIGTRDIRWPRFHLLLPFMFFVAAMSLATLQAKFGTLAFSYVVQLLRGVLVYAAVARVAVSERGERAILTGLILGLAFQAGYGIWASANGAIQTGGSLGHQNLLGFVTHLVLMPSFAMFLAGRWQRIAMVGVVAGIAVMLLTASRAAIAFGGIGLGMTLLLSLLIQASGRKALMAMFGTILLLGSLPLANVALQRRFDVQGTHFLAEDLEREAFERAAVAMIEANPMGVGPNHYVFIANTEGYAERAGVAWNTGSRSTNVHNAYLLAKAEAGYLGLIALLTLLCTAIWTALSTAVRFRRQPGSDVMIGAACGIFAMALHGLFEWMFVSSPAGYLFACSIGLVAGMRSRFTTAEKPAPERSEEKAGEITFA